ncbi:ImmA/IrrE family metallo-endopeptidase [Dactylosporangium sp. NPDC005572]|uniref:ImmA/IrrE family metallo-endopeptidase n=1 Tax=Dactylosporangium sp. NPDC005572 TaxID=3156889 RepID=UPI0033BF3448
MPTATSLLVRGFKTRSQRIATEQRALLSLAPYEPLDPRALAAHHGAKILTPADLPSLGAEDHEELLIQHHRAWSAVSITLPTGTLVVYNPTHDVGRINNSLCYEPSHLILQHQHGQLLAFADRVMGDFNERQEEEANWLAGSILSPEAALKRAKLAGRSYAETSRLLGASEDLVCLR